MLRKQREEPLEEIPDVPDDAPVPDDAVVSTDNIPTPLIWARPKSMQMNLAFCFK